MSLKYIRDQYRVPAKRGIKVIYTDTDGIKQYGEIRSSKGQYIRVRFLGETNLTTLHPKWNMEYLPPQTTFNIAEDPGHEGHVLSVTGYKEGCRRCEILKATAVFELHNRGKQDEDSGTIKTDG